MPAARHTIPHSSLLLQNPASLGEAALRPCPPFPEILPFQAPDLAILRVGQSLVLARGDWGDELTGKMFHVEHFPHLQDTEDASRVHP